MQFFTLTKELYERLSPSVLAFLDRHDSDMVRAAYPYDPNEIMGTTYLTTTEQVELTEQTKEIGNLLTKYSDGQDIAVLTALLFLPMYKIEQLVGKARRHKKEEEQRKRAEAEEAERQKAEEERKHQEEEHQRQEEERRKAEAERKEKEDSERWCAAYIAIKPPNDDAEKYLNDEEYKKFERATWEAVDARVEKGEDYLNDSRTSDYRRLCDLIKNKKEAVRQRIANEKEAERQQIIAKIADQEFERQLNEEKARLKALLSPNRKNFKSYFEKQIKDPRYTGQSFSQFLSREEEVAFDGVIIDRSNKELDKIVSGNFRRFFEGEYLRSYFLLPLAEYSLDGVPCLDFMFEVFAVVEIRVLLKPGGKTLLQEPELLGYHYFVLTPEDLGGYVFWQSIPLILLKGLLDGETKPVGVMIAAASGNEVSYKIPKFKEEVTIPDSFSGYLRGIGGIDKMFNVGIIIEKVAGIVKSEIDELKVGDKTLSREEKTVGKDTKKAKALQLFSQGKRPSDPEVKTLGIKPESAYRYYQQWKKAHNGSNNYT